ncbi:MAG: Unknown protein [uncultured Thiotrichaceae bacterium]|uniref:Uncharacterized protein n=1 Tax=uncultured Thiotrichaceae bacterium TaxID=298394 RepID=A0A6S6U3W9_9GAMM|nr:MAG: Unknown protein [uncultured Thiotrichaceae bacterium]
MKNLDSHHVSLIKTLDIEPNIPLWKRAPTKDMDGNNVVDFMMLIPKLNKNGKQHIKNTINKLSLVLEHHSEHIVFADLNMKINVLWISIKPIKGVCIEIPADIRRAVPEAVLISEQYE